MTLLAALRRRAAPPRRPGRRRRRLPGRRTATAPRARGPDRLLRQHAGAARRRRRPADVPRAARPGAAHGARRPSTTRTCRSSSSSSELHPERDLGRNPLFQVIFQLRFRRRPAPCRGRRRSSELPRRAASIAKFDLRLDFVETADAGCGGSSSTAPICSTGRAIERLVGHLQTTLAAMARRPDGRIDDLPLVAPDEAPAAGELGARARAERGRRHHRPAFDEQVAGTPDASPVVVAARPELTYRELDAWPQPLARRARRRRGRRRRRRRRRRQPAHRHGRRHPRGRRGRRGVRPARPRLPGRASAGDARGRRRRGRRRRRSWRRACAPLAVNLTVVARPRRRARPPTSGAATAGARPTTPPT